MYENANELKEFYQTIAMNIQAGYITRQRNVFDYSGHWCEQQ